ncbi:hypothetical protein LSM04_002459 [Trypanosoma melophagium]|uniref:uncharacterized protein n=1 Tax=Trypanosoma melophagium TaxID=715481 RepID=UPI00351A4806|nr:hypothetical protein LSM04_002459 [Trypanosoma melophagium]
MNLRTLTSFWKKGKGKENTNRYSGSSDTSQTSQLKQQQQQQNLGQRQTAPFEGTQAALRYIQHLLDSRRPVPGSLSSRINDRRTSTETRLERIQLLSKEEVSALRQEREEMIAALDLCLVAIPSEMVITNRDGKSNIGEENPQALENPPGGTMMMMNRDDSETIAIATATATGGGGVSSDELVVKMETDTPLPQTENVVAETNINQEQWRRLLWKLVNVLLEIDIDAYADIVMRSRQPTQSSTPLGLSPLSPTRTSLSYPTVSPSGPTCEGGENVLFSVSNPTSSATIANVTPTPTNTNTTVTVTATTVPAGTTGGRKGTGVVTTTGIDTVLNGEIKSHELRVSEEQLTLVNTITTWIILRTVLRHQIEEYSVSNLKAASREKNEVSSTAVANHVAFTSFVPWEEVVLDMMDIFCVQHRGIVESVISIWIKRENHGRELLQDILQKPRIPSNDTADRNNGKQIVTTTSVVNELNEKRVDNQVTPSTNSVTVENSTESIIMDDVVEEIEIMFEQGVIMTWVAYLEQQPSGFFLDRTRSQDEIIPSISLLHCHMMATYAVCSPHWEEERVQQAFQMLKKVWEYNYDNSSSSDVNRTLTPDIVAATGERSISSNVDGFSGVDTGDGLMEPTTSDIPKNSHMTQTASERQTTASDLESRSFRSLSVNSIQVEGTVPSTVTFRDVMRVSFEDDIMPFMFQAAWAMALHVRVEQCLNNSNREKTGACFLEEAEHFANKERDVAFSSKSFSCRQGSLESLIKVNITNGNYSAALKVANTHFNNAKKKWSGGKTSYWSCVNYLNSMGLLAQAQDACRMDASLLETTQFALQQVSLCEQVINDLSPVTGIYLVRYADARRVIYQAKLFHLRMSWISYHRMNDTIRSGKYFDLYMEHVKNLRQSKRAIEAYTALRERGEELEEEKQYREAVIIFKQATEYAKNISITPKPLIVSTSKSTSIIQSTVTTVGGAVNSNLSETDGVSENSYNPENGLNLILQTAESERNLALAYVLEAEHEVNVKERRQQLSNAVNSAYAAHNALLRCMEQVKVPSGGMLIDLAASLVVTCKALLRLGQPKKAALLLEPLIADKANSASVRPPFWSDLLNSPAYSATTTTTTTTTNSNSSSSSNNNTSINASGMIKRLTTLWVKIAACEVHTQCLSKYDGERACRETRNACEFLEKVRTWLKSFIVGEKSNSKSPEGEKEHISLPFVGKIGLYKSLIRANETIPILTITRGDSLAMLGKWEDALQEYSNALAMYSGGDPDSSILDSVQSETDRERVLNDYKKGESRVLSKLAEVYTALEKPKTAIHYYRQVLEYATESGDALLQYNTRIRLARLYTATGDTEKAADHWAKVSELAKEYEDQEISRETMRNIVAAQRANGMYMDVINTAKELNTLASSAEGVDAAADRRFALEALADAHLQLGQYKECIKVLDEQEKVQYKCGKWNGALLHMRARALLGDESVTEAIKVLTSWAHEARLLGNWVEVGHANAVLALAYATARQTLKAKRHHKIALATFACVAEMDCESCQAVMESARWLVHYFYLNDEQVKLEEGPKEKTGRASFSKNGTLTTPTTAAENVVGTGGNSGSGSGSSNMSSNSSGGGGSKSNDGISSGNSGSDSDYSEVCNDSGDLNVLMMKEEMRLKKRRGSKSGESKEIAREGESNNGSSDEEGEALSNCSMFGMNMVSLVDDNKKEKNSSEKLGTDCNSLSDNDRPVSPPVQPLNEETSASGTTTPPTKRTKSTTPARNSSTLLANVSSCKRPAVMEGDEAIPVVPQPLEMDVHIQDFLHHEIARVHTVSFRHALETMETAAQISLMPLIMREQLIPRSPAEAVDLTLLSFPHCTFVFYFAEFSTQYTVIIRPADRSFFIKRSVQAYGLSDYHTKKEPQPSVKTTTSGRTSPPRFVPTQTDMNSSKIPLSFNPITRKHHANSVDMSQAIQESNAEWIAVNDSLLQSLHDLHADLWAPVHNSMRMAKCSYNEAECFILVVDPTLLHVPFPALQDSTPGSDPLGQQFTMVVTPTLAQFLYSMRREEPISLLDAPQQDRCIFLPDKPSRNSTTAIIQPSSQRTSRVGLQSRKSSAATVWSSASAAFEDPRHSFSTYYTTNASIDFAGIEPSLDHMPNPWTLFTGCTRKEMISAFASPCCRALMILCDPVEHMFKVADGMVRLADVTRTQPRLPESLDIIVITSDRTTAPSAVEPGVAARLCLHHGCRRVLRVDLPQGNSITFAHEQVLRMFLGKLELTLRSRMRYPYALALRMAQTEARRIGYDPVVWAAFTLIGAA